MKKLLLSVALTAAATMAAPAQDFFDTGDADQLFNIGARIGLNTSNRTVSNSVASIWNQNSWGLGFDAGVVADLNIKNFISIQPGFFYESRSGAFAYQSTAYNNAGDAIVYTQLGKGRDYNFTIPVVASFHFNMMDDLRWNVDFGPYVQFKLRSTFDQKFDYPEAFPGGIIYQSNVKTARVDAGLKMGTGFDLFQHYYFGVHYLAGFCHPWNPGKLGGHNKSWLFTIGYTFF